MRSIKLRYNGSYAHIDSPSGPMSNKSTLEVGKTYLHQNLRFLRTIMEINQEGVYYSQFNRVGFCTALHFTKLCPNEATEDEIEFLEHLQK
jgi:hypothetical protein